jgi:ABC-type Fe3+-hydroxamate transport system substrate-binding protein
MRIVSLVPSLTEYLWALGLTEEVVGITKFCVHPKDWYENKTRVGGTKQLNISKIKQLEPELIIANKEENTKEAIEQLQKEFEVVLTDILDIEGALEALSTIGKAVDKEQQAQQLIAEIKVRFSQQKGLFKGQTFLYFIWKDPYFLVGKDTYIHSFLSHFGLKNACALERYPSLEDWKNHVATADKAPTYIFLSSEPFPFESKHIEQVQVLFPASQIILIDGEMCSWYGSRMLEAAAYMQQLAQMIKNQKA